MTSIEWRGAHLDLQAEWIPKSNLQSRELAQGVHAVAHLVFEDSAEMSNKEYAWCRVKGPWPNHSWKIRKDVQCGAKGRNLEFIEIFG